MGALSGIYSLIWTSDKVHALTLQGTGGTDGLEIQIEIPLPWTGRNVDLVDLSESHLNTELPS